MIDPAAVGRELPPVTVTVDAGRLRFFAEATGGEPTDLVPPTFLFGLELDRPDPFGWLADLGVDLRQVLHGEQKFVYHSPARAGDTLVLSPRITDVYAKKALQFVVKETAVTRADGGASGDLTSVIVVREARLCTGVVTAVQDGEATVELTVRLADGTTTLTGEAVIATEGP